MQLTDTSSSPDLDPLTVSWDFGDGTTGDGASVQRTYTTDGVYTVTETVSDGIDTATATKVVRAGVTNHPQVAVDDTLQADAGLPATVEPLANDSDPDGDPLTITSPVPTASHGTVACVALSCTYTSDVDYSGSDSFTYTVSDGTDSASAVVHVTVTANAAPIAVDDTLTVQQDTPGKTVDVLANDSDPDGDPLTVTSWTDPTHGSVSCTAGGDCTYTPAAGYDGTDSFTYTISDGRGGGATGTVTIDVTPTAPPNRDPVAVDDTLAAEQDSTATTNVLANDSDPDGDPLTVTSWTDPAHGSVSCTTGGDCTYTPAAGYNGSDSFAYTISDGNGGSAIASVTVTVSAPVNHPPVAVDDTLTTRQDRAGIVYVLTNDSDPDGDGIQLTGTTQPGHGSVSCYTSGGCTYTPELGFFGSDSFGYTISDGRGGTATAIVEITVTESPNNPPLAVDDSVETRRNTAVTVDVVLNDSDPDGDPFALTASTRGAHGEIDCSTNGVCTYTPDPNFPGGADTFSYTISDGRLGGTATAEVHVTVIREILSAGPLTSIGITPDLNCAVDHSGDTSAEWFGGDACGTLVVDQAGGTLYGPATIPAGWAAVPRTPYTPVDQTDPAGSGTSADPLRMVTTVRLGDTGLTITQTDAYVVGQESYRTDVRITNAGSSAHALRVYTAGDCYLQNSDYGYGRVDGSAVACTASSDPGSRIEQLFPLTPGSSYFEGKYGDVWFRIGSQLPGPDTCDCDTDEDNGMLLSWDVSVPAGASQTISYLTTFSPIGLAPLSTTKTADEGTVDAGGADGYTITLHNSNQVAVSVDSITDTLPDGFAYVPGSTTGAKTDDPVTAGQTLTWAGPVDVEAGGELSLHFAVTAATIAGTYYNNAGADAESVAVAPTGDTAPVTVTETVSNHPPVASDQSVSTDEGTPVDVTLLATDPDGDALTYSVVGGPAHGSLGALVGDEVTYTPAAGYSGPDSFTFEASDGSLDSNTATVSITVNAVDHPPVASDQSVSTDEGTPVDVTLAATDPDGDALTYSVVGVRRTGVWGRWWVTR